jgi:hypothetical protein
MRLLARISTGSALLISMYSCAPNNPVQFPMFPPPAQSDPPIKAHGGSVLVQMTGAPPAVGGTFTVPVQASGKNYFGVALQSSNWTQPASLSGPWEIDVFGFDWTGLTQSDHGVRICSDQPCNSTSSNQANATSIFVTILDSNDSLGIDPANPHPGGSPGKAMQYRFRDNRFLCKVGQCDRVYAAVVMQHGLPNQTYKCAHNDCAFGVGSEPPWK